MGIQNSRKNPITTPATPAIIQAAVQTPMPISSTTAVNARLKENPKIQEFYDHIQEINQNVEKTSDQSEKEAEEK